MRQFIDVKITEILIDNEKFLAHIMEIDIALNNCPSISVLTNNLDDDNDCRAADHADIALTDMNSGGPVLKKTLDQSPSTKALPYSGPMNNNPNSRTWKRITTGPKLANPNSEETHVGSKRGAQDHAQIELDTTLKKNKTETEVAEVSRLMAIEFTGTAVAARQHRQDQ